MLAPLIQIIIALVLIGLVLWLIQQIPMDAAIAKIIRVVVVVVVVLWLLSVLLGWLPSLGPYPYRR